MTLKKSKAWKEFSKFVRYKDNGKCYTCFRIHDPRETDAGHRYHNCSIHFFNEKLVRCQCVGCNRWKHGNRGIYEQRLIEEYGLTQCKEWELQSHQKKIWKPRELEEIYQKYKNLNMSEIQMEEKEVKVKLKKQCQHKLVVGMSCFSTGCGWKKPKKGNKGKED